LNASNLFENNALFAGSVLEQAATHQGKWQQSLLSLPEAIDLPRIVSRDLTQHSPLIAETLSLRHLGQFIGDEQKDILIGNVLDSPLVLPDCSGPHKELDWHSAVQSTLADAITSAMKQLKQFAADPMFTDKLQKALGNQWKAETGQALIEQVLRNGFSNDSEVKLEIHAATELKAQGAFAAQTNTIYLFEDFLSRNVDNPEIIAAVLLEELGHYLDAQLNASDSPGDEGAMFAAIVQNHAISEENWQVLKTENDFAFLLEDGQAVAIEMANIAVGDAGNNRIITRMESVNDFFDGQGGNDFLDSYSGADTLAGGAGNDTLDGGADNDVLDGGTEDDLLKGGTGDDIYYVDSASDSIVENINEGIDSVAASVSYTLSDNVETLLLIGSAISATGNALNNALTGNTFNNILNGNTGNDTLKGGAGNDTYYVDSAGDSIVENANEGTDIVYSSVTYALTANVENLILTGAAINGTGNSLNNDLTGNASNNVLTSGLGNDTLRGVAGDDTMRGGAGNDVYTVDSTNDKIEESANQGIDNVYSSVTYTLPNDVEKLILTGSAVSGTGNSLSNELTGNAASNFLNGGVGNDTMRGGAGNDTYYVDSASDSIVENANEGTDSVFASVSHTLSSNVEKLTLTGSAVCGTGNTLGNDLTGNAANNILNGGAGNDTMRGGAGNDTYYVDAAGDSIVESASEGTDTVVASVSYTLTSNVENLTLTGSAVSGTGNTLNNTLQGNAAGNVLNGGVGSDTLKGGAGNDTYYIDTAADSITENANEGTDSVFASVSYTLANHVEKLTLTGSAVFGTGNILNNELIGNASNNVLNGSAGNDTLKGGDGADTLIAELGADQLWGGTAADRFELSKSNSTFVTIQDFSIIEGDLIRIGRDSAGNQLKASQLRASAGARSATTLSQRVIYDTTTGQLFYDADGSGSQFNPVHIATLTNKAALSAANIYVTPTPAIAIGLQQDTGTSTSDRLTANPTITGNLTMPGTTVQLVAGFAPLNSGTPKTITPTLSADGSFTLDRSQLATINGGSLPDGSYTLYLQAKDNLGKLSNTAQLSLKLDTAATLSSFTLAAESDTGAVGDRETIEEMVKLTGQTEANVVVRLQQGMTTRATTVADAQGYFEFNQVNLALGTNTFTTKVTDFAGNTMVSTPLNLTRSQAPGVSGKLLRDTAPQGTTNTDRLTSDATITGSIFMPGQIVELVGSFQSVEGGAGISLRSAVNADGSFTLDRATLEQLNGGKLLDGSYTLSLQATDDLGYVSDIKSIDFTLDTTPEELEVKELINGIRWKEGEKLKGQLKDFASDSGTSVFYQFDGQGTIEELQLDAEGGFEKLLNIPDNAGSHTLKVFSVDRAGNQKAVDFSFLVKGTRPIVDDDEFVMDDPTNPPPTSPSDPYWSDGNTASRWFGGSGSGGGGGGMWGYGVSSGNSPAVTPSGADPNGDPNAPENKPLTYLEKVSIIIDQAMQSISTSQATVTKKAALKNRLSLLMEVADLVDEQRLYDRMRLVFYGIYDEADDLITNRAQARNRGVELAAEIIADADALKLETFQATLVGAINQVFAQQGYTVGSTAKEESLVNALLELAETYASLNPTKASDNAATPDFLDALWRIQQTIDPRTPLSLATIRAELERGIGALDDLLDGVQNKAQALKFVNNLLLAATDTASLDGEAIYDAQFLRELVAFGFEVAKLNPNSLASATENGKEAFLATFWQNTIDGSTAMRQATSKLDELFAGLETKEERLKLLKFETNLLKAIGQSGQKLLEEKYDPKFISTLIELGDMYADLNLAETWQPSGTFFLETLKQAKNDADIQKGIEEFRAFFSGSVDASQTLKFLQTLTTAIEHNLDDKSLRGLLEAQLGIEQAEEQLRRWFGSDPATSSGLEPWIQRSDSYAEEQRQWTLGIIRDYASYIRNVAEYYQVTPDAVAGVILWEALENPFNDERGLGRLSWTRPGGPVTPYGIPGKIHPFDEDVAAQVDSRVAQRIPNLFDGSEQSPILFLSDREFERMTLLLSDDRRVAIEYIGAILQYSAEIYEATAASVGHPLNIRDQAGVLGVLFQGGIDETRQNSIRTRFLNDDPENDPPQLPDPDEEKMGSWISQYRWWINRYLEAFGGTSSNFSQQGDIPIPNSYDQRSDGGDPVWRFW
jgi:Ca2+-binding RTX toxin-like protein